MRYIDLDELILPDDWADEAKSATIAVLDGAEPSDYDAIWRDLKQRLARMMNHKCWFCETPVERSDNAVDHFRPKGRVGDATHDHGGYRWLAFAPINFRYACTFCNSRRVDVENGTKGGKADRFPLVNEDARIYSVIPEDLDFDDLLITVQDECPAILDPCDLNDWRLLGCKRENGKPCPATGHPEDIARVQTSIEVYHLDYDPTCRRRHTVAGQLLSHVRSAKQLFLGIDPVDPRTSRLFTNQAREIKRMVSRKAPYSGEMRFLLGGQRSDQHPWIQELLEDG